MNWIKRIFKPRKTTLELEVLMDKLDDDRFYLHNGYTVSWSGKGITNQELFDAKGIKVSVGHVVSGRGDWGGGFDSARTYAAQISIDKDFNILDVKFDDFYNSPDWSKKMRRTAEKYFEENDFKKLHVDPRSNLYEKIMWAFDEYAGKEQSIAPSEFDYDLIK